MARRQSAYHQKYLELGAELVDRIGYDAPYRFTTTEAEHMATRTAAGMYDVYHQGAVEIRGKDAESLLQRTLVNDVTRIGDGQVLYSSICNDQGGIVDDLTVYRLAGDRFWLSPTPTRVDAVVAWLTEQSRDVNAYVTNLVSGTGFISVQGPASREIVAALTDVDLSTEALPYYSFTHATVAEGPGVLARTGYSGEFGYEFFYPREYGIHVWDAVMAAGSPRGMVPCGLGALRSVRMEKRYPLYGLDLNETTSPLEANLGWTVRFNKGDFIGHEALLRQREEGVTRTLVAIEFPDLAFLPTTGDAVFVNGEPVGLVTSADRGYFVGKSIALAYLTPEAGITGTAVDVVNATGETRSGVVNTRAAYDPDRSKARA
ncbi:MAG: glycine cleavage system aminomethyltransferase GcvT [Thermomicrobiales bacterium]|nr:glycine cleavage system aminomethyltransferase GcvT [Thermomicrobiales bacterium]